MRFCCSANEIKLFCESSQVLFLARTHQSNVSTSDGYCKTSNIRCTKPQNITLESPRGWWPQESGFREVQEPLSQALARSVGCPAPRPAHVAHPLWWLWLVNSHTFPVEKLKNTWLFLQKIWHWNKKFHIKTNKMRGRMAVLCRV